MRNHSILMLFNSLNLKASTRHLLAVDSDALMPLWLSFLVLSSGKCEHLLLGVPCTGYCGRESSRKLVLLMDLDLAHHMLLFL